MELDNTGTSQDQWNPTPLKNVAVVAIVFNSLFMFLFILFLVFSGELYNIPDKDFPPIPEGITKDEYIQSMIFYCAIGALILGLNTVGSVLMMRKHNAGWILYLVTYCLFLIPFMMSLFFGDVIGTIIFFIFLTLTILAGKHRYKEEQNFENYTN